MKEIVYGPTCLSEDNLGCQSSPSTLLRDRPSCVFSAASVELAGPQSCRKSPVCTSHLQGHYRCHGKHVASMWILDVQTQVLMLA